MGGEPARIWPVIMPGRETIPAAAMALMIGIIPVRTASWSGAASASRRVAP